MLKNHIMKVVKLVLFLILLCFVTIGCGGGGGGGGGGDGDGTGGGGNNLQITVLDNDVSNQPVSNVSISIYESDNETIEQTIVTGNDGVADFGNVTAMLAHSLAGVSGRVTVTVAFPDRSITTLFNIVPGNYTIYNDDTDDCNSQGTVNATFDNIDGSAQSAMLTPYFGLGGDVMSTIAQVSGGTAQFIGVSVCSDTMQDDGKISFLALANSETDLVGYGYILDQTLVDAATYNGTAALLPTDITWTSSDPVMSISVGAIRKGVNYSLLGSWASQISDTSGSFSAVSQFPDALLSLLAVREETVNNSYIMGSRQYSSLPSDVQIVFTDNDITAFGFDAGTGVFTWTLTGSSPTDIIIISAAFDAATDVDWLLMFSPDANGSITLPDLPTDVQAWFNPEDIIEDDTGLTLSDIGGVDGYDAALSGYIAGDITEDYGEWDIVNRNLDGGGNGGDATFTVGGAVTGNTGTLELQNNGGDDLVVTDSTFTFPTTLPDGAMYVVTVKTPPAGQTCILSNSSGTISGANVNNVIVSCFDLGSPTYSVGGTVTGLTGTVTLQNNGGDDLPVTGASFVFGTELNDGADYNVTVLSHPIGQTCTVNNSSGTISGADVNDVTVTCVDSGSGGDFGSLTFSGSGASLLPITTYIPIDASNMPGSITWNSESTGDSNNIILSVIPDGSNPSNAVLVSVGWVSGGQVWIGAGPSVSGVTISANSVTFMNTELPHASSPLTLNGTLTY